MNIFKDGATARWRVFLVGLASLTALLLLAPPARSHSPKAHSHGLSEMEVTIEGSRLQIRLQSPMEDLVGFERKPRNEREREQIKAMGAQLGDGQRLFGLPGAAGCSLKSHEWQSSALDNNATTKDSDHADVRASWLFECTSPKALKPITVNLFDAFSRMKSIKLQLVSADAQRGATLTRGKRQINW